MYVMHSPSEAGLVTKKSREQYMKDVEKSLKLIKDGESYELCLTTQMRKKIGQIDYMGLYLKLREKNPAPYAAWLNFSKENLCICCSSPERFLRLDGNGILEAKPIKGTIARGLTKEEDELLKFQLQYRSYELKLPVYKIPSPAYHIHFQKKPKDYLATTRKKLVNDAVNVSWKSCNDSFLK